ncbi:hypothetical protein BJ546DRAFT_138609 [Cryomyces antarcticus]
MSVGSRLVSSNAPEEENLQSNTCTTEGAIVSPGQVPTFYFLGIYLLQVFQLRLAPPTISIATSIKEYRRNLSILQSPVGLCRNWQSFHWEQRVERLANLAGGAGVLLLLRSASSCRVLESVLAFGPTLRAKRRRGDLPSRGSEYLYPRTRGVRPLILRASLAGP